MHLKPPEITDDMKLLGSEVNVFFWVLRDSGLSSWWQLPTEVTARHCGFAWFLVASNKYLLELKSCSRCQGFRTDEIWGLK